MTAASKEFLSGKSGHWELPEMFSWASRKGNIHTIALTGNGGRLAAMADVAIAVPSDDTQYIQETHLAVEHILCELVESVLFRDQGVQPAKQHSAGEDSR